MVYLDYEIGSSTRIDVIRSKSYNILPIIGGYLNIFLASATGIAAFNYLLKRFEASSRYKYIGSLFLSASIAHMVFELGVINYGTDFQFLLVNQEDKDNFEKIRLDDRKSLEIIRDEQRDLTISNLGKVWKGK